MQLRDYQKQAISDLRASYRSGKRAPLLVLPTGSGKTVIFAAITQSAAQRGNQVLILVHRRELIHQASAKLTAAGVAHGIIAAGIQPSDQPVQVASVQTLVRRLATCKCTPDLIIIDEAHHATTGSSWAKILENWPTALRLGVTATPIRLDSKGLGDAFDLLITGPSIQSLIAAGHLTPARIYAPPVVADLSALHKRSGDYKAEEAEQRLNRPSVTGDAIKHWQRLAPGLSTIAFCCTVAHAVSVQDSFKTAGITAELLLGETKERDRIVQAFAAGHVKVLITVDVVSEGFDCPTAAAAILLRPTASLGLFLQQVGRVLRPAPGKTEAIILDHVGNVLLHGFPDDHRDWTLKHGVRTTSVQTAPSVRTCPECFAAFKPVPQCPVCGHEQPALQVKTIRQVEGELQELQRQLKHLKVGMKVGYKNEPLYGHPVGPYTIVSMDDFYAHLAWNNEFSHQTLLGFLCPWPSGSLRSRRGRARTLPQLLALAKEQGYSSGWAYRIHQARGQC